MKKIKRAISVRIGKNKKLEKENPEFVTFSSPTQKVGGKTKKIFAQVSHEVQMQSLQDVL